MEPNSIRQRLVVVSNRLPIVIEKEQEQLRIVPGSGGLVTALAPVLRNRGGLWIGWTGYSGSESEQEITSLISGSQAVTGYTCYPVFLDKADVDGFYHGFSNEIIWPLFHDLPSLCHIVPEYWYKYLEVNGKFAEKTLSYTNENDFIWVQDYHLLPLGQELKKRGCRSKIGFFLHIPFPSPDIFLHLPWRFQVIRALLEYDLIGFQTTRDRKNFIRCIRALLPEVSVQVSNHVHRCKIGDREVQVGVFPIGIDYSDFANFSRDKEVSEKAWYVHEAMGDQKLILSIDRLDYTKGIPYRLEAFRNMLKRYPEMQKKVALVQVVVPSRVDIPRYASLREEVNRLVGEINSEFSQDGWVPIHYFFRHLSRSELVAYYRTCEVALVTSLKDGMNLVAKEYIACNADMGGVLILSEFAGAAAQLSESALIVNPFDIEGVADVIVRAIHMAPDERKKRMQRLKRSVKRHDIFWWVKHFLNTVVGKELNDFPIIPEYLPKEPTEQKIE